MSDIPLHTLICSVLFLDIEAYSTRSSFDQLALKKQFNSLLTDALRHVAMDDRIVLDTGDGAAIGFLSKPEDALFTAMGMRDAIASTDSGPESGNGLPLRVRMGINLGPVHLVKDINGQINMLGAGINDAQRVMSFSLPGKILVSRSYYEVISRLSNDFAKLFTFDGTRTDKHVREHEVYVIEPTMPEPPRLAVLNEAGLSSPAGLRSTQAWAGDAGNASMSGGRRTGLFFVLVALLVAGLAIWWAVQGYVQPKSESVMDGTAGSRSSSENLSAKPDKGTKDQDDHSGGGDSENAGPTTPGWVIDMRKALAACPTGIKGIVCKEKIRWKYCPKVDWKKYKECRVTRSDSQNSFGN